MPFYRSTLQDTSGGGGGGGDVWGSIYVKYESIDDYFTQNPPQISLGNNRIFASLNNIENASALTEIKFGNGVNAISSVFYGYSYFNCPINLFNTFSLTYAISCVGNCFNYNSQIEFPNFIQCPPHTQYSSYVNIAYNWIFANCNNYNQPTTIRIHARPGDDSSDLYGYFDDVFYNCKNLNSKIIFDIFKYNYNNEISDTEILNHSLSDFFCGCSNFNQPMIFYPGASLYRTFSGCHNYNQPVVCDFRNSYFERMFDGANNMSSDIIFLHSNDEQLYYPTFNGMISNMSRGNSINIYIYNMTNIKQDNIVANVSVVPTWTAVTNGFYNSTYNIYLLNNVEDALNNFNNYYHNFYGEYPIFFD